MKKTLSILLAVLLALSCFASAATAASFETESGVQVQIAPFLYKSTQYQMEFPSHQSYAIKEKSIAGDYAISREKEEQLTARLNGDDKELFQNYVSAYIEFSTTSNADSFISGFRLGAKFAYDTFVKNTKG